MKNGFALWLVTVMLTAQVTRAQQLAPPSLSGIPATQPAIISGANTNLPAGANEQSAAKTGWQIGVDGKFEYIIRIPKSEMEAMEMRGEEIAEYIPDFIKPEIDCIIIQIGPGQPPQIPSANELRARAAARKGQSTNAAASAGIVRLDAPASGGIKEIDKAPNLEMLPKVVPTAGAGDPPSNALAAALQATRNRDDPDGFNQATRTGNSYTAPLNNFAPSSSNNVPNNLSPPVSTPGSLGGPTYNSPTSNTAGIGGSSLNGASGYPYHPTGSNYSVPNNNTGSYVASSGIAANANAPAYSNNNPSYNNSNNSQGPYSNPSMHTASDHYSPNNYGSPGSLASSNNYQNDRNRNYQNNQGYDRRNDGYVNDMRNPNVPYNNNGYPDNRGNYFDNRMNPQGGNGYGPGYSDPYSLSGGSPYANASGNAYNGMNYPGPYSLENFPRVAQTPYGNTAGYAASSQLTTPSTRDLGVYADVTVPKNRFAQSSVGISETDPSSATREKMLPVFFLLSFVINLYLGVLIYKLIGRYRALLSSVRSGTASAYSQPAL